MKKIAIALLLFVLGAGGAYTALVLKRRQGAKTSAEACGKHSLKACPFCDKSQVEKLGQCAAHKVPEALCHQCRPELVPAFKIEGDWCGGHEVPESQCELCGGGPVTVKDGKVQCNKHKIAADSCPFCDKSLIEKLGMCPGHKVPEALCSRCNPDLIPAFKAENDWCEPHKLPESQCQICLGHKK